jgi:hypothetical protein
LGRIDTALPPGSWLWGYFPEYAASLMNKPTVSLLDLIGVRVSESGNRLYYMPWVRVAKHESSGSNVQNRTHRPDRLLAVDIVHKDYFRTYLDQHLYLSLRQSRDASQTMNRLSLLAKATCTTTGHSNVVYLGQHATADEALTAGERDRRTTDDQTETGTEVTGEAGEATRTPSHSNPQSIDCT